MRFNAFLRIVSKRSVNFNTIGKSTRKQLFCACFAKYKKGVFHQFNHLFLNYISATMIVEQYSKFESKMISYVEVNSMPYDSPKYRAKMEPLYWSYIELDLSIGSQFQIVMIIG